MMKPQPRIELAEQVALTTGPWLLSQPSGNEDPAFDNHARAAAGCDQNFGQPAAVCISNACC